MKRKIIPEFEYDGFGFLIKLQNVSVVEIRGVQVPDIDYNNLQKAVLFALSQKPAPLTGNELRFIRQYFQMTYVEFATTFGVTHPTVINWEKAKDSFSKIDPPMEIMVRLRILEVLKEKNARYKSTYEKFFEIREARKNQVKPIIIDMSISAA